jgi:hypothetical protein
VVGRAGENPRVGGEHAADRGGAQGSGERTPPGRGEARGPEQLGEARHREEAHVGEPAPPGAPGERTP